MYLLSTLEPLSMIPVRYWTDQTVQRILGLQLLRHVRVRASSMISDQSLYHLMQTPQQLTVELEPSYSMSSHLGSSISPSIS